jgi:hypothetical protein
VDAGCVSLSLLYLGAKSVRPLLPSKSFELQFFNQIIFSDFGTNAH